MSDTEETQASNQRNERLARRTKEEQEAKRRSRRGGSSSSTSTPSSSKASSGHRPHRHGDQTKEERTARRTKEEQQAKARASTRSTGDHRPSNRRGTTSSSADRDAKQRSRPASKASKPGAESVSSSSGDARSNREARKEGRSHTQRSSNVSTASRDNRDRDAKRRSRRNPSSAAPAVPGVERVSGEADHPRKAKLDFNEEVATSNAEIGTSEDLPSALAVEATMVEETGGEDLIEKQVQQRMQQMLAQQQEEKNIEQDVPQIQIVEEHKDDTGLGSNRCRYIILAIFCLVIVGGVSAFFATRSTSEETVVAEVPDTTASPNAAITSIPTESPTKVPSSAPTDLIKYDPPIQADCLALENQSPVADQDGMVERSFEFVLDVTLFQEAEVDEWLESPLVENIVRHLVPFMAGCNEAQRRALTRRRLVNIRYVIADAIANGRYVGDSECEAGADSPCYQISLTMDFFLKGEERNLALIALLTELIAASTTEESGMVGLLQLEDPFRKVVVVGINNLNPTESPSTSPTMLPSLFPTDIPSPSPTTPAPTGLGSVLPTATGSSIPTQVPSSSPTNAPTPVPTPNPTVAETTSPTRVPTGDSTPAPTKFPTAAPTELPTLLPTDNPTMIPTTGVPTTSPTKDPTPPPTQQPIPDPTPDPTPTPSPDPTPPPTSTPPPTPPLTPPPTPQPIPPPTPAPTSRQEYFEGFFPAGFNDPTAMNWLANIDTWDPPNGSDEEQLYLERYIMALLYYETNGPNTWDDKTNWLDSNRNVCDWFGCKCDDGDYRLTELEFFF